MSVLHCLSFVAGWLLGDESPITRKKQYSGASPPFFSLQDHHERSRFDLNKPSSSLASGTGDI